METVTKIDKAGRVVIPKEIRERLDLVEDSSLLISESHSGVIILKKLDIGEIAKQLKEELKNADVESIVDRIETESNERAKRKYKVLRR
jgi:AbrB family looped-hinge helix DNA binding protein